MTIIQVNAITEKTSPHLMIISPSLFSGVTSSSIIHAGLAFILRVLWLFIVSARIQTQEGKG